MQEDSFKLLLADKAEEVNKTDIEETSSRPSILLLNMP